MIAPFIPFFDLLHIFYYIDLLASFRTFCCFDVIAVTALGLRVAYDPSGLPVKSAKERKTALLPLTAQAEAFYTARRRVDRMFLIPIKLGLA